MENLNDAEFGSNKSTEEAPILVAQRYLNIFRQVHIFNKAKRDQFDDELLALPPVITDFFKRMPGGRLLVEHIEEVKTERGISFVKSNKEDFAEGSGVASSSSTPAVQAGGAVAPIVGGSVTVDASFAEALAQSMATAFKQTPMQATVSGGGTVNSTLDFGNAFDVIAEEIRTSRASLLDVLKETRSITDSVIASQVSISRILEGILSARTRDDIGTADLNNRIIASQASITKLLEGLYTANSQKNNEISDYLNIENKLQTFKNEVRHEIENSLNKMQAMFLEYAKNTATSPSSRNEKINNQFIAETPSLEEESTTNYIKENISEDDTYFDSKEDFVEANETYQDTDNVSSLPKKKKKKKKKNKNLSTENPENPNITMASIAASPAVDGVIRNQAFKHEDDFSNVDLSTPPLDEDKNDIEFELDDNLSNLNEYTSSIDDDGFDDGLDFTLPEQGSAVDNEEAISFTADDSLNNASFSDDGLDFELPSIDFEETDISMIKEENFNALDELATETPSNLDDLTFEDNNVEEVVSEHIVEEDNFSALDELATETSSNLDDLTFEDNNVEEVASTPIVEEDDFSTLDELTTETSSNLDDLTFEDNNVDEASSTPIVEEDDFSTLDELATETSSDLDNLTFEDNNVDEASSTPIVEEDDFSALDELTTETSSNLDDLTFEDNNVDEASSTPIVEEDDFSTLDELATETSSDLDNLTFEDNNVDEASSTPIVEEDDFSALDELTTETSSNLDDLTFEDNNVDEASSTPIVEEYPAKQSRYSEELDKIREALTSDNIDISSIDEPIALDDYGDDENLVDENQSFDKEDNDEDWEYEYVEEDQSSDNLENISTSQEATNSQEDWEYEYVDENGNPIEPTDSDDWEWEYVEEEEDNNSDNNQQ